MLNGASLNARRFNIGVRPEPKLFAGDAVGECAIETDFVRTRHFEADAPVVATADIMLSAQRYLNGDLLTTALSELDALRGRESGRIAVGAMPLSRARLLPGAIAAFHRAHPGITVAIVEGSHAELIEPLRDGELDLLVGALRTPEPGGDVAQQPLFDDHPIVVSRAGHPLTRAKTPGIAALARYPWTIAAPGTPLRAQWERMFRESGVALPDVPVECGSVMTIRQLLLESDFLTLLSRDQVAVELEAGWLVKLCDTPPGLKRTIGITTRAGWRPTAAQQAFLDALKRCAITL